ncbi:MAG: hypothetical protein K9G76_09840 [Bacteroidales bacterium]|nr:hypothetical protein [Bacteroidales bacterium]MCF8404000.1 hypothetical protein [Bacteroidales bacterium]
MKEISLIILYGILSHMVSSQSLTPEVMATSGDYYKQSNSSISFTLGESSTETHSAGGYILTQGFQQPFGVTVRGVDVHVFLEGPFGTFQMNTELNTKNLIPVNQPYNDPPWNYDGNESADPIPNPDVVDWVLIELRDADSAGSAKPSTRIARQAAFLLKNGSVVGVDGSSILQFNHVLKHKLFVAVWHRNHLGIISADPVPREGGIHLIDFSTSLTTVYHGADGYKEVSPGLDVFAMAGGDANADGIIDNVDKTLWNADAGTQGYKATDFDLDAQVNNQAKNKTWVYNGPYSSQVIVPSGCGTPFVDDRNGQSYNTVEIGSQCWMAENLNIGALVIAGTAQSNNGLIERYCYNNSISNCDIYGGLYQWDEAMAYSTMEGTQGICPDGWHLPKNSEFIELLAFLGSEAGSMLKEAGTEHWIAPNIATNESGFTALGAGFVQNPGNFFSLKARAGFWSSSEPFPSGVFAYYIYLVNYNPSVYNYNNSKTLAYSVRCLKD